MKCRRVCGEPDNRLFFPQKPNGDRIVITVDELEALRLSDWEQMEQDEAAARMAVSRGTFQRILYAARKKSAQALFLGCMIEIAGGHYHISNNECRSSSCSFCPCKKRKDQNLERK